MIFKDSLIVDNKKPRVRKHQEGSGEMSEVKLILTYTIYPNKFFLISEKNIFTKKKIKLNKTLSIIRLLYILIVCGKPMIDEMNGDIIILISLDNM